MSPRDIARPVRFYLGLLRQHIVLDMVGSHSPKLFQKGLRHRLPSKFTRYICRSVASVNWPVGRDRERRTSRAPSRIHASIVPC